MLRFLAVTLVAVAMMPSPASAQDSASSAAISARLGEAPGPWQPQSLIPMGQQSGLAGGSPALGMMSERRDTCWKQGCVIILNQSRGYDVVGFYLDENDPLEPGSHAWGRNQFADAPLRPMKALYTYRKARGDTCEIPVRLVLRSKKAKAQIEAIDRLNLCPTPGEDVVFRISVNDPTVTLDEPG